MEKSNFKIGGAYCIYLDKLQGSEFYYIVDEKCEKEFWADIFYANEELSSKKELSRIPVFIQYIGNGMFREVVTNKIFSVLKGENEALLEDRMVANPTEIYDSYDKIITVLKHFSNNPLVISVNDIFQIGAKQLDEYDGYNKQNSKGLHELLDRLEQEAKDLFKKTIEQYSDSDYIYAKEEDEHRAKQLIK